MAEADLERNEMMGDFPGDPFRFEIDLRELVAASRDRDDRCRFCRRLGIHAKTCYLVTSGAVKEFNVARRAVGNE